MSASDLEAKQLYTAARAYLEWEAELTGFGVPLVARPNQSVQANAPRALAATGSAEPAARPASGALASASSSPPVEPLHTTEARVDIQQPGALGGADAGPGTALDRRVRLAQIEQAVQACVRCELAKARTKTVFARGNPDSPVMFIGEGPGQEEDRSGLPFVGPAGQLLDRMIAAMGFARDAVYICNVVKCRPPGNRTPLPAEAGACSSYLLAQLDAIQPRVIVALGRCATENLGLVEGGGWRGRWGKFRGIDVMPTYHPAFLLRSPEFKRPVWEDLQKVMSKLKQA